MNQFSDCETFHRPDPGWAAMGWAGPLVWGFDAAVVDDCGACIADRVISLAEHDESLRGWTMQAVNRLAAFETLDPLWAFMNEHADHPLLSTEEVRESVRLLEDIVTVFQDEPEAGMELITETYERLEIRDRCRLAMRTAQATRMVCPPGERPVLLVLCHGHETEPDQHFPDDFGNAGFRDLHNALAVDCPACTRDAIAKCCTEIDSRVSLILTLMENFKEYVSPRVVVEALDRETPGVTGILARAGADRGFQADRVADHLGAMDERLLEQTMLEAAAALASVSHHQADGVARVLGWFSDADIGTISWPSILASARAALNASALADGDDPPERPEPVTEEEVQGEAIWYAATVAGEMLAKILTLKDPQIGYAFLARFYEASGTDPALIASLLDDAKRRLEP